LASVGGDLYPIPINRTTINKVFNLSLTEDQVESFLDSKREHKKNIKNSEDVVLSSVGHELCEMFFRGYTKKQWSLDLSQLSAGVASRIPTRKNDDDRYFSDAYQFMPANGYGAMFKNIFNSENIKVQLNIDFLLNRNKFKFDRLIYTGPLDEFYRYKFGKLPYRSLRFEHEHLAVDQFQSVGTVNYPNEYEFTRITEFKHLTGQKVDGTSIVREYPTAEGDPYYPIPNQENETLFKKYQSLTEDEKDIYFVGRLAQYRYYNMDQVIAAAMHLCEKLNEL
jgi:UDP-galactopyranose mutase